MAWARRVGAVLIAPRSAFRAMILRSEGGIGDIIGLMFLIMLGSAPVETARAVLSASRGIMITLAKLVDQFVVFALAPMVVTLALGLVLAGILRIRGRRVPLDGIMTAAVFLWVPVGVLSLVGAWLAELGLHTGYLPHVPLASFLAQDPPLWQLALRLLLSYGWSAALVWPMWQVVGEDPAAAAPASPRVRWAGWLLWGLLAGSWITGGIYSALQYERIRPVLPGDPAAAFSLPRADGQGQVSLTDYRGKPVVVEFWADWCQVCLRHMPQLAEWSAAHPDIPYLAIHQGGTPDSVRAFLAGQKWQGPLFAVDGDSRVSSAYRVDSLPTFFLITPDGKILAAHVGAMPEHWIDHQLGLGHAGHDH